MTRWTHNGKSVGQPQRPWRLTRAQRVGMEAALAGLRVCCGADALADALYELGIDGWTWLYHRDLDSSSPARNRERRILRARVAIALRAALRADEDARCEEAAKAAGQYTCGRSRDLWSAGWERGYDSGISSYVEEAREWPPTRHADIGLVPLALWEVEERRRRETVRVLEALLVWGLS